MVHLKSQVGQISLSSFSLFLFFFVLIYPVYDRSTVHGLSYLLVPSYHIRARVLPDLLAAANQPLVHSHIMDLWTGSEISSDLACSRLFVF